jgi:hypothetical protein
MLIWINGAFGSGKTLIAHGLQRRLRDAQVTDPEVLGFALHKMLPASARQDFQDLPQWRSGILATLIQAHAACDGQLIVPMSIVRDDYFDEIVGGLRSSGVDVRHYALTADRTTLHRRLERRSPYVIGKVLEPCSRECGSDGRHQKRLITITTNEVLSHTGMVLNRRDDTVITRQPRRNAVPQSEAFAKLTSQDLELRHESRRANQIAAKGKSAIRR